MPSWCPPKWTLLLVGFVDSVDFADLSDLAGSVGTADFVVVAVGTAETVDFGTGFGSECLYSNSRLFNVLVRRSDWLVAK